MGEPLVVSMDHDDRTRQPEATVVLRGEDSTQPWCLRIRRPLRQEFKLAGIGLSVTPRRAVELGVLRECSDIPTEQHRLKLDPEVTLPPRGDTHRQLQVAVTVPDCAYCGHSPRLRVLGFFGNNIQQAPQVAGGSSA